MKPPFTISRALPADLIDNFDALKQEAINWLAKSCDTEWSDFNAHDPGVQILEELCYGLTELGYRAAFPIESILANQTGKINWGESALFAPPDVFPMNPLTINDYRRLILDRFPDVFNVWLEPCGPVTEPNGGYDVWLALEPWRAAQEEAKENDPKTAPQTIRASVAGLLSGYRNLGEHFASVKVAPVVKFWPQAAIPFAPGLIEDTALADLYRAVRKATLARPATQTLVERKAAGERLSQTLTGPLPEHGIVLDAALGDPPTWDEVRQRALMAILPFTAPGAKLELLCGPVPANPRLVVFDFQPVPEEQPLPAVVKALLAAHEPVDAGPRTVLIRQAGWTMPKDPPTPPRGELTKYRSIQDGFPPNYALRENEAPLDATALRRAQIKQLKGYLLFFEQILANGLAQLGRTGELLSGRWHDQTYFPQTIYDVPGLAPLLKGFNDGELALTRREATARMKAYRENPANAYQRGLEEIAGGGAACFGRCDRFLDHLLARFGESYPQRDDTTYATIANKAALLRDYPELGRTRATGADPVQEQVSGLEAKITRLLARNEQSWPAIKGGRGSRFYYLLEPALLGTESGPPGSSFKLTHVFVNWTEKPLKDAFREYVQEIVLENSGAHLLHEFLWYERKTAMERNSTLRKFMCRHMAWARACRRPNGNCAPAAAALLEALAAVRQTHHSQTSIRE